MADIQRKTYNLFDVSQLSLRNGYAINDNGVEIESQYTGYTLNHISCKQETQYVLSYLVSSANNGYYRVYFYDEDDNFISRTSSYVPTAMPFEMHITTPSNATSFAIQYAYGGVTNNWNDLMINSGSTAKPYEPYGWLHSLRKLTTATEAVENPLYSDGTAITSYTLKGNEEHTGTPTPSNPVDVNGLGVRTENLFDINDLEQGSIDQNNGSNIDIPDVQRTHSYISVSPNTTYIISNINSAIRMHEYSDSGYIGSTVISSDFTTSDSCSKIRFNGLTGNFLQNTMLNTGSTAKPFEPYGYKIPISSGGVTTNIYLGSTQTVRKIKKLVFDGTENWKFGAYPYLDLWRTIEPDYLREKINICYCSHLQTSTNIVNGESVVSNTCCFNIEDEAGVLYYKDTSVSDLASFKSYLAAQYANGTPVTLWYILATPETAAVNEPLMKIGTYADTLSNAASIPTTEGANSITVDTTVQPTEFTATWAGWHDASVKEAKHGNNLFDYTTMSVSDENSYLNSDGTIGVSNDWNITEYIPCDGTSFTIGDIGGNTPAICLYNANKEYITGKSYNTGGTYSKQAVNITSQTTAKFIRFSYCKGSLNPDDISAIMLNSGSTLLPYEPYSIHWE